MQFLILWQHFEDVDLGFRILIIIVLLTNLFIGALENIVWSLWQLVRSTHGYGKYITKFKDHLGDWRREADNAKRKFKETGCEGIDWMQLDQDGSNDRHL
jgi:hypothetical protein